MIEAITIRDADGPSGYLVKAVGDAYKVAKDRHKLLILQLDGYEGITESRDTS